MSESPNELPDLTSHDAVLLADVVDDILIVAMTDADGVITYVNDRFCDISKYSRHELLGATHAIVNSGYHDPEFFHDMYKTLRSGRTWRGNIRNRAKDGSCYWVATTIVARRGGDGRIVGYIATRFDITELMLTRMRLGSLAVTDSLTGLVNRAGFHDRMTDALRRAAMGDSAGACLVMFDLDGFKHVNDNHGHDAGDRVLRTIATRLTGLIDPADTICRLGGDEFALILEKTVQSTARDLVMEQILATIEQPVELGAGAVMLSGSLGVLPLAGYDSVDEAQKHADLALYAAKRAGGRQVRLFGPDLRRAIVTRSQTLSDAKHGVAADEFETYFQPILTCSTGQINEVEALLRWHHPQRGLLPASSFDDVLADSQFMSAIVARTMRSLVSALQCFREHGMPVHLLGINLSRFDLLGTELQKRLLAEIDTHGLATGDFVLEISSWSVFGRRANRATDRIHELAAAGFQIAIDGFGDGPTDFRLLRNLPVSQIKVAQCFARGLADRPEAREVLKSLIDLGHACGMTVCVMGIETEQEAEIAIDLGADRLQGFLVSYPLSIDDAIALVNAWPAPDRGAPGKEGWRGLGD
ncbi:EAL domain-containing protein [Gluconacetobacter azotocaptans]|uniref:EAL domain-containing protein n=1 Tax=Gluconacetobacter azotocaptans TaxID=142834 RepID=A0A7W4JQF9_9PROT|nr:EAL domain-containing protein [Gluconacetobacter azotocaptans]MBB2189008.1 EAL domain-containing protein [Gluconacetobacter azotocaptans]MBM9403608.1 EAL domain-containing protein [Gluconacetobacter azotocaptans]